MSMWQEIKYSYRRGTMLVRLLYINGGVFLAVKIAEMIDVFLARPLLAAAAIGYLAIPAELPSLATRFWTPVTYMFLHQGFIHLIFNLLWLYWFGRIFLQYLDQRKLVALYIMGGLSGALFFVAIYNIFPAFADLVPHSLALGASASVMAIVVGISAWVPNHELHLLLAGRIRIKYIALFIFLITSIIDFSDNTGGKIAHIGGAAIGLLYVRWLRTGFDAGSWINSIIDTLVNLFRPGKRLRVKHKSTRPPSDDYEYNRMKAEQQAEIDRILEKISKGGYESLTSEEKRKLFTESQKNS